MKLLLLCLLLVMSSNCLSQIQLVKDINTDSTYSTFREMIIVNDVLFFSLCDGKNGQELWKSDGTAAGTKMMKDINEGVFSSVPKSLTKVNNSLFFSAFTKEYGRQIWKSDGSENGTELVGDIVHEIYYDFEEMMELNGSLLFRAISYDNGYELWKTGLSGNTTNLVKDIAPGRRSSNPMFFKNFNDTLYFSANDSINGFGIWRTDGTDSGTERISDLDNKPVTGYPRVLGKISNKILFTYNDGIHGTEIWTIELISGKTELLIDINERENGTLIYNSIVLNNNLFFTANIGTKRFLWKTNGEQSETINLQIRKPSNFCIKDDNLYFISESKYLCSTDGRGQKIDTLTELNENANYLISFNDGFYYTSRISNKNKLFYTTGNDSGTEVSKPDGSTFPGISSYAKNERNDLLYFFNKDELWKIDKNGFDLVFDKSSIKTTEGSGCRILTPYNEKHFFYSFLKRSVWSTDGTENGTTNEFDINIIDMMEVSDNLIMSGRSNSDGLNGLWSYDRTEENPALLQEFDFLSFFSNYQFDNDLIYFLGSLKDSDITSLWKSDGTISGTEIVKDITTNKLHYSDFRIVNSNNTAYFTIKEGDSGNELWFSDGNANNTNILLNIPSNISSRHIHSLTYVGKNCFFEITDYENDVDELWISKGSKGSTHKITERDFINDSPPINSLTNHEDDLYFVDFDIVKGYCLMKFDRQIHGVEFIDIINNSRYITSFNGRMFFFVTTEYGNYQIWQSEGSPGSYKKYADIDLNIPWLRLQNFHVEGNIMYIIIGNDTLSVIVRIDDYKKEIVQILKYGHGLRITFPHEISYSNGILYFVAYEDNYRHELWKYDIKTSVKDEEIVSPETVNCLTYPNPFTDYLNLNINVSIPQTIRINMIDMYGNIVRRIDSEMSEEGQKEIKLNTNGLSNGIYLLDISGSHFRVKEKILKVK